MAATLALVFAMSGAAVAAGHYLITSTHQISPSVLKSLKGDRGATGPAGVEGRPGIEGSIGITGATGYKGSTGATGPPGVAGPAGSGGGGSSAAAVYEGNRKPGSLQVQNEKLFLLDEHVEAKLLCANAELVAGHGLEGAGLEVSAPTGSSAYSGMVVTNSEFKPAETSTPLETVTDIPLEEHYEVGNGGVVLDLFTNSSAPTTNIAHVTSSVATPTDVITIDAFMESSTTTGCTIHGTATSVAR